MRLAWDIFDTFNKGAINGVEFRRVMQVIPPLDGQQELPLSLVDLSVLTWSLSLVCELCLSAYRRGEIRGADPGVV